MFIATTILFIIGNASLSFLLYFSIQSGQWLDLIFKWQKMLRNFDISGTKKGLIFHKILGGCSLCFAHLIAFLGFWAYFIFVTNLCQDNLFSWWKWFILYFIYVPTTTNIGLYFITKR